MHVSNPTGDQRVSGAGAPLYYSHPASLEHDPRLFSPRHPDTPERLLVLEAALAERDWLGWERRLAPAASEAQLELVHDAAHVRAVRELCEAGGGAIDADTFVGPRSYEAALHAAGGAWEMTRALLAGEVTVGFCGLRPSGHHAERARAMGFCLFDSIAVAAAEAIASGGLQRVFVLDWDVHHGNGTAEIFRTRRDVLFASLHQSPLYPGTGPLRDAGSGEGEGYTINLPVPPGTGPELWMELFDRVVLPAAAAYEPQLILVSAGFDAHAADPLAHCLLETETFVVMASRMRELAALAGAPLGLVLEGGYDAGVLAECVCAVLPVLAGEDGGEQRLAGGAAVDPLVARAVEQVGRWWPVG
jgi:acetoin utilization deacetylase AcuC-like enzyme